MVHFVGAGCGAPDLITLRGHNLLKNADVVIYAGSLVNPQLLEYTKPGCQIHNSALMTLEEVLEIMYLADEQNLDVVRLHTGDPSIYGAIREQMDLLDKKNISYDSCPGVSACFGAAAGLNLEFTLPEVSQSLIITRMEGKTGVPKKESIESFAAHNATMAIYLSASNLSELKDRLLSGGYKKDTPCALCYKVTWPEEAYFRCTLDDLPRVAAENNITKTALVLVGDAIAQTDYALSRLYASDFETEFRKIKN